MNLLTKTFGAGGSLSIDLSPAGLTVDIKEVDKITTEEGKITVDPGQVLDSIAAAVGSPTWLAPIVAFLKDEIAAAASKAAPPPAA